MAFLHFFVTWKRNCQVNTGLLCFADGKYQQATITTIVPLCRFHRFLCKKWLAVAWANWKTKLGELRGIPGCDFWCWWLTPLFAKQMKLIFALSHFASTAVFLVNSRTWIPLRNCLLMILYSKGVNFKIAIALVNSICC